VTHQPVGAASACDRAQGYLFSEPLAPDAFEKLLRERAERPG